MYYIWCDESQKEGPYYSNFYGGILIDSKDYNLVLKRMKDKVEGLGIREEIKWQKVNACYYERYVEVVNFLFDLMEEGLVKMRIFFRHNKYVPKYDNRNEMRNEYTLLYYQFIKHGFGLKYSTHTETKKTGVRIFLDELPINQSEKKEFVNFLVNLTNDKDYKQAGIVIKKDYISEVNSKNHLPLQMMDLILGSIYFRLNDLHKVKDPDTGRRGKRTICKEKLYKQIYFRIRRLRKGFNIGISTGISEFSDNWTMPYRHWSFIPSQKEIDNTKTKHYRQ